MLNNSYKIYIIQMQTNTIPAKIIKLATSYKYSHIAIAFDENCDVIYSFGRINPNSILKGGFVIENKTGEFFKKFNKTICRIYELEVTEEQYCNLRKIVTNMEKNIRQYKYDFIGIVLRFFKIPITFKDKYVCSFFVADILEKANIYKFTKQPLFVNPKDFEKITDAKEIYSGKYISYCKESE